MRNERSGVAFIARQPVSLTQRCEILVAVQFPDNLFVTDNVRIEIVQTAPMRRLCPLARNRLELPINWITKIKIAQAKQIETSSENAVRLLKDSLFRSGPATSQLGGSVFSISKSGEEVWLFAAAEN